MTGLELPFEAVLRCKSCGFNCVHQERVDVFERGEDQEYGVHVSVGNMKAVIDTSLTDNPSKRRDGVSIFYSCEACNDITRLDIYQHKGNTFIEDSVVSEEDTDRLGILGHGD